jgi:signal transduction histidine kinase/DNA-binding response OmpR family regulator
MARKARIALGSACVGLPAGIVFAARYWTLFDDPIRLPVSLAVLSVSFSVLPALAVLRAGRPSVAVHMVLGCLLLSIAVIAYHTGALKASALYWLMIIPSVSAFSGSVRTGLLSLAACQVVFATLLALELSDHIFPEPPPREQLSRIWFASACGLTLVMFAFVVVFERAKEATLSQLRQAHRALVRARDSAHKASASKSEFLARVSHEIRTPMTAILGYSDLLLERLERSELAVDTLETIRRNARHLLEVINDILDHSKIEAGLLQIDLQSCDPVALTRDVVSLLKIRAQEGGVTLRERLGDTLPRQIRTDPKRLRQILINLVGNAIKFSEGREVQISVEVVERSPGALRVRFEVRDTGIGMSAEQLDRLFEPFRQAEASTVRRYGGTGLGLSISRRLCELMGGSIHAQSTEGEGSTFWVDLPFDPPLGEAAHEEVCPPPAIPSTLPGAPRIRTLQGHPRVLFADDVADNRALVEELLRGAGAEVVLVADGAAAIEAARRQPAFDVIVLDLDMPGMTGFEVAHALRACGYTGTILALSAWAMAGDRERCVEAGFDALISKPFESQSLLQAIERRARPELGGARLVRRAPPPTSATQAPPLRPAGRWERTVRLFVPPPLRDDAAELQRVRLVVGLVLAPVLPIVMWAWVLPRALDHRLGPTLGWMLAVTVPLLLAIPVVLRFSRSAGSTINAVAAYTYFLIGAIAYCTGGAAAPAIFWLIVLPMVTPALGLRSGLVWTVLALVQYVSFYALERFGGAPSWVRSDLIPMISILSVSTLNAFTTTLMLFYEKIQRGMIQELARANDELSMAQQASERASRSKSDFIAHVSHEMRTPMTAIIGFSELLAEEWSESGAAEGLRRGVEVIHRNSCHLLGLINSLLDLSRVEAGGVELERIAFDPRELCGEVAELLRVRTEAKGIELRLKIDPAVPGRVQGDPTRVRQILLNLVGNAVKFTRIGSVEIRLSAPGGRLRFEVDDTGVGIGPSEIEALFQPFRQGAGDRQQSEPGSGLGLAISLRLCQLMGGDLGVVSALGEGSCFTFHIPFLPVAGLPEPAPAVAPAVADASGYRVLLAEDGKDNQVLIGRLLRKAGMEVTLAENGERAVEVAELAAEQGQPFDLILMDMQMPVLSGYEAVRTLRAGGYAGPIIALTAHAFAEEHLRCLEMGCDAFATKPITRDGLLTLVRRWAARAKQTLPSGQLRK